MANGYMISINLGGIKPFTTADSTPGTAGIEINVDHTKFTTPSDVAHALRDAAEWVLENNQPIA